MSFGLIVQGDFDLDGDGIRLFVIIFRGGLGGFDQLDFIFPQDEIGTLAAFALVRIGINSFAVGTGARFGFGFNDDIGIAGLDTTDIFILAKSLVQIIKDFAVLDIIGDGGNIRVDDGDTITKTELRFHNSFSFENSEIIKINSAGAKWWFRKHF